MGSGCEVKVQIDRTQTDGTFTNYDILKGVVKLIVTTSISLKYIQVKIEGVSKTQLYVPRERKKRDDKMKEIHDVHRVLYDTMIVFPPDNVRKVSQAREFSLVPGNYCYPFEFKIPLNNSCVKLSGISNKISFNKKSMNLTVNNGNFNASTLVNLGSSFIQNTIQGVTNQGINGIANMSNTSDYHNNNSNNNANHMNNNLTNGRKNYHITSQLPPSLSGVDNASIKYFIKVTCKRSSILKSNLRAYDPFDFLPLDLDSNSQPIDQDYEEYREIFVRKEIIFKDRIPEIIGVKYKKASSKNTPKRGILGKFLDTSQSMFYPKQIPEVMIQDVPFYFEIRFRYPAFLIPLKKPSFKLYLISKTNPSQYTLGEYEKPEESNGLGVVYLHRLSIKLISNMTLSVLEDDGYNNQIHQKTLEQEIPICDNSFRELKFDLKNAKKSRSSSLDSNKQQYELEIPRKYYQNAIIPGHVSPSFRTCNITGSYNLKINGVFTCTSVLGKSEIVPDTKSVDLECSNIKVLSGLNMTSTLHANASRSDITITNKNSSQKNGQLSDSIRPSHGSRSNSHVNEKNEMMFQEHTPTNSSRDEVGLDLPTYDAVMREDSFQNDSEHQGARRRYQQHAMYYQNLES